MRDEALVLATVTEAEGFAFPAAEPPQAGEIVADLEAGDLRPKHRRDRFSAEAERRFSAVQRAHQLGSEPCQIARRRPEACRRHFRIDVPAACDWHAIPRVPGCRSLRDRGGKRLLERAVRHTRRLEHELSHQIGKRFPDNICDDLLCNRRAAPGISDVQPGNAFDDDRQRICGRHAVQDLSYRRPWACCRIAREPVDARRRAVAEQLPQRDPRRPSAAIGNAPRRQGVVHIGIEIEHA